MNFSTAVWLSVFGVLAYIVSVDPNVSVYVNLLVRKLTIQARGKFNFLVRENPDLPWVRWKIQRNADKAARLLRKEFGIED